MSHSASIEGRMRIRNPVMSAGAVSATIKTEPSPAPAQAIPAE